MKVTKNDLQTDPLRELEIYLLKIYLGTPVSADLSRKVGVSLSVLSNYKLREGHPRVTRNPIIVEAVNKMWEDPQLDEIITTYILSEVSKYERVIRDVKFRSRKQKGVPFRKYHAAYELTRNLGVHLAGARMLYQGMLPKNIANLRSLQGDKE